MMFIYTIFALSAIVSSAFATPTSHRMLMRRDVNPANIPQFGVTPGVNPTGTGNCDGITGSNGVPIQIPCDCPPNRDLFIADLNANVAAGFCTNNPAVKVPVFPEDNSAESQLIRLYVATVTLQNLNGPGRGCPQASTTWGAQASALQAIQNAANSSPPPAASPPAPSSAASTDPNSIPAADSSSTPTAPVAVASAGSGA